MPNSQLALPYFLPYFVYVACAALPLAHAPSYGLRLLLTGAALLYSWRFYQGIRGPRSPLGSVVAGFGAGLLGTALWVLLLIEQPGEPWDDTAFLLRLFAAGLFVPVFEEMALRGFVLRYLVQMGGAPGGVHAVAPGAWTWRAVLVSSVAFALGHRLHEMAAAVAYGLLMALLWIVRRDLLGCIVAHATTNVTLAFYVRATGAWGLW